MTRARLVVLALILVAGAGLLIVWGTRWTVPQATVPGGGYALQATWDGTATPSGTFERPIGVAVAPNGDVYVADASPRIVHFNRAGEFIGQWGRAGDGPGEFRNPVGIAVAADGVVYVSDFEHDRIQKFTATGELLLEFGGSGSDPGQFSAPSGLAIDDAGFIYVTDFYNHRVQKFQANGSFEAVIGHSGRLGPGALHYPTGVHVTAQREILVADAYNYQLQWFDQRGQPRRRTGYHVFWLWPRPATSTGGFHVPTGVAIGSDRVIHVADSGNHRIVMLSPTGEYLAHWQIPDADSNVFSPEQVAASPDGSTVYATDLAKNRVLVLTVKVPGK